jgi:hypothetical protein
VFLGDLTLEAFCWVSSDELEFGVLELTNIDIRVDAVLEELLAVSMSGSVDLGELGPVDEVFPFGRFGIVGGLLTVPLRGVAVLCVGIP